MIKQALSSLLVSFLLLGCASQRGSAGGAPVAQRSPSAVACPQIKGNVVVFGGRGAPTQAMSECYPGYLAMSLEDGNQNLSCLASQIDRNAGEKFVIVGHSSGAATAENLARSLSNKDPRHVRLILLEGYSIPVRQTGVVGTCWYGENKEKNIKGFNAPSMLDPRVCPQPANAFQASWCTNNLCLHIANVNLNVPGDITASQVFEKGLTNCRGNTAWMSDELREWLKE